MELTTQYALFKNEITDLINQGKEMNSKNPSSQEELDQFISEKRIWENSCVEYFKNSFKGEGNDFFANSFLESRTYNNGFTLPLRQLIRNAKDDLTQKTNDLEYTLTLVLNSDIFINPEIVKEEKRGKWPVQKKRDFILKKLSDLNNGMYHDVSYLFWSNGLEIKNHDEPRQMGKHLEQYGLVEVLGSFSGLSAKITMNGIEYLESIDEEQDSKKSDATKEDISHINERLDEVMEWLVKNDLGNELIFNEIQELKDAGEKLNLKNWKQLVKGKVIDMGIEASIGLGINELKEMFKVLTGGDITKLLK